MTANQQFAGKKALLYHQGVLIQIDGSWEDAKAAIPAHYLHEDNPRYTGKKIRENGGTYISDDGPRDYYKLVIYEPMQWQLAVTEYYYPPVKSAHPVAKFTIERVATAGRDATLIHHHESPQFTVQAISLNQLRNAHAVTQLIGNGNIVHEYSYKGNPWYVIKTTPKSLDIPDAVLYQLDAFM